MQKGAEAFRSIGEVSRLVGVAAHVLRYWETQFPELRPVKRKDGRRYYRPDDVRFAAGLCQVLREDGLTIRGTKKLISVDRGAGLRALGAGRLGEQWALEEPAPPASVATLVPVEISAAAARIAVPARAVRPRRTPEQALPLFPELIPTFPDFLLRVSDMAATLREWPQGRTLPRRAAALAENLAEAFDTSSSQ